MKLSTESIDVNVCDNSTEARAHGKGGLWYTWRPDTARQFPQDVASVFIVMPVNHDDIPPENQCGVVCEWTIDRLNQNRCRWWLSGKQDAPTLFPSLHWVGVWHGWLQNGHLKSC